MSSALISLAFAVLASGVATPALAEKDFDEAIDLAASDGGSPDGQSYAASAGEAFGPSARAAVRQCLSDHAGGSPAAFQIIVQLGASGSVEQVWQSETTRAQGCVTSVVETRQFAPPPFAPFHLLLGLGS